MKTTEKKLLSNEEIASFCSQAAMLFQAGIPPVEGMAILQSDAQSDREKAFTKHWKPPRSSPITACI